MNRNRLISRKGAYWGGILGGFYGCVEQLQGWLNQDPQSIYTGVPQGADLMVYMSLCQSIWRAGNGFTYSYPFTIPPDATPAILLQLPFSAVAWMGWITGLPVAFEILRVLGAAACGALLPPLLDTLFPSTRVQRPVLISVLLGGTVFWVGGVALGIKEAGVEGISILHDWTRMAAGHFYWWLPNLVTCLRLPLETVNHATLFLVLLGLARRRHHLALLGGMLAWMTNPFPGLLASMIGTTITLLQMIARWVGPKTGSRFTMSWSDPLWYWVLLSGLGLSYYGPFQSLWPDLAEVSRMHRMELTPAPSWSDMAQLVGPWSLGYLAVPRAMSIRQGILRFPLPAALSVMAVGQILLQVQGWVLGSQAFQPYHFNRGWLGFSLILLVAWGLPSAIHAGSRLLRPFWRIIRFKRARIRILLALTVFTSPDVLLFLLDDWTNRPAPESLITPTMKSTVEFLQRLPGPSPRLVHPLGLSANLEISAFTPHVPYNSSHWIAFPFSEDRQMRILQAVRNWNDSSPCPIRALGISVLIMPPHPPDDWARVLGQPQWIPHTIGEWTAWVDATTLSPSPGPRPNS